MRTFKNLMLLVMTMSLLTLTSCSNDDDNSGGNGGASDGTLVAKIDGTSYQSMDIASSATVANGGQNLIIIAANSDGNAFSISIFGYSGPGTYPLGGGVNITNAASYTETDVSNPQNPSTEIWQAPYDATEVGSVTITEETDTKIKGNFEFMCKNVNGDQSVKNVTDGGFNLDKQVL